MRILCPTDFTPASINGIEYAAQMAKILDSSLMLINVQMLAPNPLVSLDVLERTEEDGEEIITNLLDETSREIENRFNVRCDYLMVNSDENYEKVISRKASEYHLTVMGSNGSDDINQYYFGSHSFRMAKHSFAPVLIVPENASFSNFNNIVLASDYAKGDQLHLKQLTEFTKEFSPRIHVLHISKEDNVTSREMFNSYCRQIEDAFYFNDKLEFRRLISDNAALGIEQYMKNTNSDLLTVLFQEHNVLYRLFHENLIKKLTSYAEFPILIFHS